MSSDFDYNEAFSRNIGLLTDIEQSTVREFTIAIPGMGGVGGAHLIALVRQGFERFKIADFDNYDVSNSNRQYGANTHTYGRAKVEVMCEEACKINPNCTFNIYDSGVNDQNIDDFLEGVDLVIDGLDAFAIQARRLLFMKCHYKHIPVITAGPIGFGVAYLVFKPDGKSFDDYFAITDDMTEQDQIAHFMVGLVPALLQRPYMLGVNLDKKVGPSSVGAVNLCAGVVAVTALKLLLNKGEVKAIPYYHQFDVMRNKYVCRKLWFGNRNPIQRIKLKLVKYLTK